MRCYDLGRKYFSSGFVLFARQRPDRDLPWRLGMAVTRKTGSAVRRNRVRRLIRECFRLEQEKVPGAYDFVVVPKRRLEPRGLSLAILRAELVPLLSAVARQTSRTASA